MKTTHAAALTIFLLLFCSSAIAVEIPNAESAVIDVNLSSDISIARSKNAVVDGITATITLLPRNDYRQKVKYIDAKPGADIGVESIVFKWQNPTENILQYAIRGRVATEGTAQNIYTKVAYPVAFAEVPEQFRKYLEATEKIDPTDPLVKKAALGLAEGEDDLYIVASKIAAWVKSNIAYNLSSLTANAVYNSSWVLKNRQGVCDEITVLFIAMLRSLGIPAKFISGLSHTTSPDFPEQWGAHGWAEVYFPQYGWIPFDVTFGEYGWIDAGHVKLKESLDPSEPTGRFEWTGKNFNITARPLDITAGIIELGAQVSPQVLLKAGVLHDEVGFGSLNLVIADIENLQNTYMATELSLARVNEIEALNGFERQVILKPKEKQKVFWRIKVKEGLDEHFGFEIPVLVYTPRNESSITYFKALDKGQVFDYTAVTRAESFALEEFKSEKAQALQVECMPLKVKYYPYDTNRIDCIVRNNGNENLRDLNMCITATCTPMTLFAGEQKNMTTSILYATPGLKEFIITFEGEGLRKTVPVAVEMLDIPEVEIKSLRYTNVINAKSSTNITFTVAKKSESSPQNVVVNVVAGKRVSKIEMPYLEQDQPIAVEVAGKDFIGRKSGLKIVVEFEDENGRHYEVKETAEVELTNISFIEKAWFFIKEFMASIFG